MKNLSVSRPNVTKKSLNCAKSSLKERSSSVRRKKRPKDSDLSKRLLRGACSLRRLRRRSEPPSRKKNGCRERLMNLNVSASLPRRRTIGRSDLDSRKRLVRNAMLRMMLEDRDLRRKSDSIRRGFFKKKMNARLVSRKRSKRDKIECVVKKTVPRHVSSKKRLSARLVSSRKSKSVFVRSRSRSPPA